MRQRAICLNSAQRLRLANTHTLAALTQQLNSPHASIAISLFSFSCAHESEARSCPTWAHEYTMDCFKYSNAKPSSDHILFQPGTAQDSTLHIRCIGSKDTYAQQTSLHNSAQKLQPAILDKGSFSFKPMHPAFPAQKSLPSQR